MEQGEAVKWVAGETVKLLKMALDERNQASLILAGGNTFKPVYALFAKEYADVLDWSKVHLLFGDERLVPLDDPASNYRMVCETWLNLVENKPVIYRFSVEKNPEEAVVDYEKILENFPEPDVCLLGIGLDGHTASLFAPLPNFAGHRVALTKSPLPPADRISLTPEMLNHSKHIIILALGSEKAEILAKIKTDTEQKYPISQIKGQESTELITGL